MQRYRPAAEEKERGETERSLVAISLINQYNRLHIKLKAGCRKKMSVMAAVTYDNYNQ